MEFEQFSFCSFYGESVSKGFFGQRQCYVQQVFLNSPELFCVLSECVVSQVRTSRSECVRFAVDRQCRRDR